MPALVAVVMTAYNSAPYIGEALSSLRDQLYRNWECVVVDDGSADNTAELVRTFVADDHRIRLIRKDNGGVSQARNTGLAAVDPAASYVAFFDSDDRYLPDALTELVAALDARPDAAGVYGYAEYLDAAGVPDEGATHSTLQQSRQAVVGRTFSDLAPADDSTFDDLSVASAIWPSAVALHRKSIIDIVDGFDDSFTRQGDWDFYVRMSRFGPYPVVRRQVAWYRRHSDNLTSNVVESCFQQERVRFKAWQAIENSPAQKQIVARGARRLQLADGRRMTRRAATDLRGRRPGAVLADAHSLLLMAWALAHPGPARPDRRRVVSTRRPG